MEQRCTGQIEMLRSCRFLTSFGIYALVLDISTWADGEALSPALASRPAGGVGWRRGGGGGGVGGWGEGLFLSLAAPFLLQ